MIRREGEAERRQGEPLPVEAPLLDGMGEVVDLGVHRLLVEVLE